MAGKLHRVTALCLLFILLLSACFNPGAAPSPEAPAASTSASPAPTPKTEPQPISFTWSPFVYSDIYRDLYGEAVERDYAHLVEALTTREERFICESPERFSILENLARSLFPPYAALISGMEFENGKIAVSYVYEEAEHRRQLTAFANQITALVQDAVMEGDSSAVAAIALYHSYSKKVLYDHEAASNEVMVDVSPYRALTQLEGICQSFAGAYAYLCLQLGIDAVPAGGLNRDVTEAHEWTLLRLDGEYYYADPTFENGVGSFGLRYFGMTAAQRELEGDFPAADYNIGNTNILWGRDISVTDERFAPLWEAASVIELYRGPGATRVYCRREDGSSFSFLID